MNQNKTWRIYSSTNKNYPKKNIFTAFEVNVPFDVTPALVRSSTFYRDCRKNSSNSRKNSIFSFFASLLE